MVRMYDSKHQIPFDETRILAEILGADRETRGQFVESQCLNFVDKSVNANAAMQN